MSKFTEFDANKLHKVYRKALRKREDVKKPAEVSLDAKKHGCLSNFGPTTKNG